ncbi:Scavenger mRNA-decapping enzyme DcpS [Fasciola gigantica]|uniref:m7GpppX diphosphatase n=1 Tax=Fasciola gigantica TaxID=46835 RepID=A0A504YAZ2_FASGI|nr:Scavenger mRNA-decapping enzyme DcpS [Fasciola gigantica]
MPVNASKRQSALNSADHLHSETSPVTPAKRHHPDTSLVSEEDAIVRFRPQNMHLVSVLSCDASAKRIALHTRLNDSPDKDAIVIFEKSAFPKEPHELIRDGVIYARPEAEHERKANGEHIIESEGAKSKWTAKLLLSNDVYYRLYVTHGLDLVSGVDMTVIYPAEKHHFKKYLPSGCRLYEETPAIYRSIIVPFLSQKPRDLSWVENILSGEAETDRVIFSDGDPEQGFTLVLDYRWSGRQLNDLHCLGIIRRSDVTCLRDLRASHIPLLKRMLHESRTVLSDKYTLTSEAGQYKQRLDRDQILAFFHYPPTFYHLHMHFIHINCGENHSTRAGRAHVAEEVIRNLEIDSEYYSKRVITVVLHESGPMFEAVHGTAGSKTDVAD